MCYEIETLPICEEARGPPDHDVDIWPKDWVAGKDRQLEKAIELALDALKKSPPKEDERPSYPKRAEPK